MIDKFGNHMLGRGMSAEWLASAALADMAAPAGEWFRRAPPRQ